MDYSEQEFDYGPRMLPLPQIVIYGVLALFGVICNGMIVGAVARRPLLGNFPYIVLASLALVDIVELLWTFYFSSMNGQTANSILCRMGQQLSQLMMLVAALLLVVLAVVRWRAISRLQFGCRRDVGLSVAVVASIWLLSGLATYPFAHFSEIMEIGSNKFLCYWREYFLQIFATCLLVFSLGVCSLITLVALVAAKRRRAALEVPEVDSEGVVVSEAKKQTIDRRFENMLLVVWAVFFVFTLALNVLPQALSFYPPIMGPMITGLVYLPAIYKLFLYRGMDHNFRRELNASLGRKTQATEES